MKAGRGGGGGGVEGSRDEVVLPARAAWGDFVPGSSSPLHPGRLHRCLVLQGAQIVPGVQDERTEVGKRREKLMLTNEGFFPINSTNIAAKTHLTRVSLSRSPRSLIGACRTFNNQQLKLITVW